MSGDPADHASGIPARTAGRPEPVSTAPHRLDVLVSSVPGLVVSIGGWLVDRALAGWDVKVYLPRGGDATPLRILGATPCPRSALEVGTYGPARPTALAVDLRADEAAGVINRYLNSELPGPTVEITTWGSDAAMYLYRGSHRVRHQLSGAAMAFKGHALRAADIDAGEPVDFEVFHTGPAMAKAGGFRLSTVADDSGVGLPAAPVWAPLRAGRTWNRGWISPGRLHGQ